MKPLCFVLRPFGNKKDPSTGLDINFDRIYDTAVGPGIDDAGMDPIRADEERTGGIIHKPMFERLLLCDYAVADLTTANANVFYELGVRHAARPATTLALFARHQQLPFDVNFLRALPYGLGDGNRFGDEEQADFRLALAQRLEDLKSLQARQVAIDSPIFQLLEDYSAPDIARLKTDVFRQRAQYAAETKGDLARARDGKDIGRLHEIQSRLGALEDVEAGILVDLYLSYRAVGDFDGMVALYDEMPATLKMTVLAREQLGFALNRLGRREEALRVLEAVLKEHGPSSETCGLMGRVYKDRWAEAKERSEDFLAVGYLDRAIEHYLSGFEADMRDAYPGINAVALLDIKGTPKALETRDEILPVVRFAVKRRLQSTQPDYWDHATLLELALLADDADNARACLAHALARVREPWEPRTTANNLRLIREARKCRGSGVKHWDAIIAALDPLQ
jgi:tetratricopeptide (TPR) repeat protein